MKFIVDDILNIFKSGHNINRLIVINLIVFVVLGLMRLILLLESGSFESFLAYLVLSNDWVYDLTHPWVFVTNLFVHLEFFHLLWNMLFLYWFGRIVGDLLGDRHIHPLYFLGGIFGNVVLLLFFVLVPSFHTGYIPSYGASAAVMSIVMASGMIAPDYEMNLLLIGRVKLKYVVLAIISIDVLTMGSLHNTGGHIAHLGGVLFGWFYIYALRNGWQIAPNFLMNLFDRTAPEQEEPKREAVVMSLNQFKKAQNSKPEQHVVDLDAQVDHILDKISKRGIDSLTSAEYKILEEASKKKK